MFASFVLTLKNSAPASVGHSTGVSTHALLLNLIRQRNPALAEELHADAQSKPFTASPLRGRVKRAGDDRIATPSQSYSVRYTTLREDLFNSLSHILLGKYLHNDTVRLDGAEFSLLDVAVEPGKSRGWGAIKSAEEIWENAPVERDIALRFVTPTTFRQRGVNLLFPIPTNVFHSYREKWNAFTPFKIEDNFMEWVEESVAVEAHHLQTRMVWFGDFQERGFVGWARYIARDKDAARLKQLNALADFAFFCGTGAKTTQGMGQTRRVNDKFANDK